MPVADPYNLTAIENAIHAWFVSATGLPTHWMHARAPEPVYPYGALSVLSVVRTGSQDETRVEDNPAPGPPAGQEILVRSCGLREMLVSCHAYAVATSNESALAFVERARASLGMATYLDALRAVGVAVLSGAGLVVRQIPTVIRDEWIAHAQMDVLFGFASNVTEPTTNIETAVVTPIVDGITLPNVTLDVTAP